MLLSLCLEKRVYKNTPLNVLENVLWIKQINILLKYFVVVLTTPLFCFVSGLSAPVSHIRDRASGDNLYTC